MKIKHKFFSIVLFLIVLTTALYILAPDNNLHKKKIGDLFTKNIISKSLVIRKIEVKGAKKLSKKSILEMLQLQKGSPIHNFDSTKIRKKIESMDWVEKAEITRFLNGTINITILEKSPIALWKKDNDLFLIDVKGQIIEKNDPNNPSNLLLILGDGAPEHINNLLSILKKFPNIHKNIRYAQRISNRRWDLGLKNHSTVLLPEKNYALTLEKLSKLETKENILSKKASIDMRIPKKIIFKALD